MKRQFISLKREGLTIPEIAERFNLYPSRVYALLQEIADENGVSRDSLLDRVQAKPTCYVRRCEKIKPIDTQAIELELNSIINALDQLEDTIKEQLKGDDLDESDE